MARDNKNKKAVTLRERSPRPKSLDAKQQDSSPTAQSDTKKAETRVEIKPAKGRPMLTWVGKKPLRYAIAYPAQLVETFHADNRKSQIENRKSEMGLLFHGDNNAGLFACQWLPRQGEIALH